MACTLTAVPYISFASSRRNVLLNPAFGAATAGVPANAAVVSGAGGATSLAVSTQDGSNPSPAGVPASRLLTVTQTTTATAGATTVFLFGQQGQVTAGASYVGSVWVRSNEARSMLAGIEWQNSSGVAVGYSTGPVTALSDGASRWYRLDVAGVAPATATRANLQVATVTPMAAGQRFRFCAPIIALASEGADYFEVGQPVPVGSWASWSGVADASYSILTRRTPYANLARIATPTLVLDYAAPRESGSVAHRVMGRADPVHALGPLRTREGTLQAFYATAADADAAVRLHEASRVMLRDSDDPTLDMYYVPRSVTRSPTSEKTATQRWVVTVDYTEVYGTADLY